MQSDWHRYNLKRRVASLPPLDSDVFAEKVLANKATAAATAAKASYERLCPACQKTYYSENAYVQHLSSGRHKTNVARLAREGRNKEEDLNSVMSSTLLLNSEASEKAPSIVDGIDEEAEKEFERVIGGMNEANLEDSDPVSRRPTRPHHSSASTYSRVEHLISPTATKTTTFSTNDSVNGELSKADAARLCLFCTHRSEDLDANVMHMARQHGMFIPERPYLTDLEGLILYLSRKVHDEYQCLYCGRLKWSEDGIKTHMRDSSHCKIAYDTEEQQLELGDFYDFRSTYSDGDSDEDWEDSDDVEMLATGAAKGGGVKLGAKRSTTTTTAHDSALPDGTASDSGWETDSTVSDVPTSELGAVYSDKARAARHPRRHRSADGFHARGHAAALYHDDVEMLLPSGRTAGHRALARYFRQNLRGYPSAAERAANERRRIAAAAAAEDDDADAEMVGAEADAGAATPTGVERGRPRGRELVSRAQGGLGMAAVGADKVRQVGAAAKREARRSHRDEARFRARVDRIGNQQKHFRDALLQ